MGASRPPPFGGTMLTRITVDIDVKRVGGTYSFKKGDVLNLARWPEVEKAMEKVSRRQAAPRNKMVTDLEEK